MAVPAELEGAKGNELAAEVAIPILFAIVYGIYNFVVLGVSQDHYLYTYAPVFGGIAALVGFLTYYFLVLSSSLGKRSWKNLLLLLGLLPYLFSFYIVGFLGLYMIYRGTIQSFSIWSIIGGLFWTVIGYRGISKFHAITDSVSRHSSR
jgi:4-amino-4-deoxy-L-arabinose transferase-like glycosyltransferase